ncbi:hypothetical protein E2C01_095695 [Portunus trituberculatus]|uniref:Uncharacterized protein n=1 Tax=Portunus trituberculatus TaxID=210409 RepID=A0A5B7K6F3_PORTR|nr:hypothetical protein [Portunus trituberculatus]
MGGREGDVASKEEGGGARREEEEEEEEKEELRAWLPAVCSHVALPGRKQTRTKGWGVVAARALRDNGQPGRDIVANPPKLSHKSPTWMMGVGYVDKTQPIVSLHPSANHHHHYHHHHHHQQHHLRSLLRVARPLCLRD